MQSIQTNLLAINADNFLKVNSKNNSRAIEKLSSGYRINRAADDAAGLAISEKMRRLIRGLKQGTANAQDGVSFVQVADGAMDEVSGMLQRMYELALKSLNGTCSDSDRAALNAEFDRLREEVDRINKTTQFNDQPVFEEHEGSYYQITGNKKWDDSQLHTIPALNNELKIHLPDYYEPSDYTLTVPAGVYTTQELVDEIDSALEEMIPSNPGFVFEYTDEGICKLNFERADGMPTEIASVEGSLSYLFFDSYAGSSSSSLIGTTVFDARYPLTITANQNDRLEFFVENANGSNLISMTIRPGRYLRSEMIDEINKNLAGTGVIAKEYGESSIQITGGDSTTITGLKGNMFKLEMGAEAVYSSVFYDNVRYGSSAGGTAAYVTGRAYYNSSYTEKISLSSGSQNNVLRFKVNGAADYTEITFPDGEYTIDKIAETINDQLADKGLLDTVKASYGYSSVSVQTSPTGSGSYSMQCLILSSLLRGTGSSLEFDTTDSVSVNTYNALFRETNYLPYTSDGKKAQIIGAPSLSGAITLADDASLTFKIDNQNYTISNIGGKYADCQALVSRLNTYIDSDPAVKNLIEFKASNSPSGPISIVAKDDSDVQNIYFEPGQQNSTYKQLFVSTSTQTNYPSVSYNYGTVTSPQGSTAVTVHPASSQVSIPTDKRDTKVTITDDTNKLSFTLDNGSTTETKTVTLAAGDYSMAEIVTQINAQLNPPDNSWFSSMTVSYENDYLTLTAMPSADSPLGSYRMRFDSGSSVWKAIRGTYTSTYSPTVIEAQENTLGIRKGISFPITLDSSNNELELKIGSDSDTVHVAAGTYSNADSLKNALQAAIDNSDTLKGKVTVSIKSGILMFSVPAGSVTASGSFYDKVNHRTENEYKQKGEYSSSGFRDAYIIGRKDLTTELVDIISGANDTFIFNFAYTDTASNGANSYNKEMQITIPEGTYTGEEVAKVLQERIQKKFEEEQIEDFDIKVSIGGETTNVVGANDDTALQIKVSRKDGKEPAQGQYVLDGIRGSAAGFLFYKTTINPKATYIAGTKDLSNGVIFKPGQNVFTFSADAVPYKYTFPENTEYTAEEFVNLLNEMFADGDDDGKSAPLTASLENGALKIAHKALGSHSISDIGGSARGTLFLEESTGKSRPPIHIQVGVEATDSIEIPRTRVSSCSLAINTITISRPKYATKAVNRLIDAIAMVNSRRSTYGSMQNRLEHTINNNNNIIENTQASESAIRDADIAYEAMERAKYNILMQFSQTILAQANQQPRQVLNLLQS